MASHTSASGSELSPDEIGTKFVTQYYGVRHGMPKHLHRFYAVEQSSLHVSGASGPGSNQQARGQRAIHDALVRLGLAHASTQVLSIDAQRSAGGAVMLLVLGRLRAPGSSGPLRAFAQTFFLAQQEDGYCVLNDVLRVGEDAESLLPALSSGSEDEPSGGVATEGRVAGEKGSGVPVSVVGEKESGVSVSVAGEKESGVSVSVAGEKGSGAPVSVVASPHLGLDGNALRNGGPWPGQAAKAQPQAPRFVSAARGTGGSAASPSSSQALLSAQPPSPKAIPSSAAAVPSSATTLCSSATTLCSSASPLSPLPPPSAPPPASKVSPEPPELEALEPSPLDARAVSAANPHLAPRRSPSPLAPPADDALAKAATRAGLERALASGGPALAARRQAAAARDSDVLANGAEKQGEVPPCAEPLVVPRRGPRPVVPGTAAAAQRNASYEEPLGHDAQGRVMPAALAAAQEVGVGGKERRLSSSQGWEERWEADASTCAADRSCSATPPGKREGGSGGLEGRPEACSRHEFSRPSPAPEDPGSSRGSRSLFVRNMPPTVTLAELAAALSEAGPLRPNSVRIKTQSNRDAYAFAEFEQPESLRALLARGLVLHDRALVLDEKKPLVFQFARPQARGQDGLSRGGRTRDGRGGGVGGHVVVPGQHAPASPYLPPPASPASPKLSRGGPVGVRSDHAQISGQPWSPAHVHSSALSHAHSTALSHAHSPTHGHSYALDASCRSSPGTPYSHLSQASRRQSSPWIPSPQGAPESLGRADPAAGPLSFSAPPPPRGQRGSAQRGAKQHADAHPSPASHPLGGLAPPGLHANPPGPHHAGLPAGAPRSPMQGAYAVRALAPGAQLMGPRGVLSMQAGGGLPSAAALVGQGGGGRGPGPHVMMLPPGVGAPPFLVSSQGLPHLLPAHAFYPGMGGMPSMAGLGPGGIGQALPPHAVGGMPHFCGNPVPQAVAKHPAQGGSPAYRGRGGASRGGREDWRGGAHRGSQ